MKMRNRLAALLATAMVATSVPVVTMAATNEIRVSGTVTVTEDTVLNKSTAPKLTIEDTYGEWQNGRTIWLTLKNGEWQEDVDSSILEVRDADGKVLDSSQFDVEREDEEVLRITKKFDSEGKLTLRVSLQVKVDDDLEDGDEVTVSVDGSAANIDSKDDIVLAEVSDDAIKVKAGSAKKFAGRSVDINDITLTENYAGAFKKGDEIRLEIARGFEWDVDTTTSSAIKVDYGRDELEFDWSKDSDEDELILKVTKAPTSRTATTRVKLTGLTVRTEDRDSEDYGDVEVEVSGDNIKDTTIVVAKYVDYGAETEVKVSKKDVIAGRKVELPKVTLSESVSDSINFNRNLEISFPEGVNVVGIKSAKLGSKDVSKVFEEEFEITKERLEKTGKKKEIVNEATVNLADYVTDKSKAQELKIEFEVETEVSFSGDLNVTFGGRAMDGEEEEVKLATVVTPIKVEAEETKVDVGLQGQKVGKITITENVKGGLQKGTILIGLENLVEGKAYGKWDKEPSVNVVSGNLKLGDVKLLSNGLLSIEVKSTSKEPATIEITDGTITTSRAVADGKYAVEVYGDAFVNDDDYESEWDDSIKADYLTVGDLKAEAAAKAEEEAKNAQKVSFTIGQATFTKGESTELMDVAPYISQDNRTMVPLRYVAQAMGVDEDSILFDNVNSIVTIFHDNKVVQVQIGSKTMLLNGTAIPMDTEVVIQDGRTFLPISWIARALGVSYEWDSATGTVTFN